MLHFRQTILRQIKAAPDEKEIKIVIDNSIQRLKSKNINGHIIQRFILAMEKTLYEAKLEGLSGKAGYNMDVAIDLFKELRRP